MTKSGNTFGVSMEFAVGDHASDFRSLAFWCQGVFIVLYRVYFPKPGAWGRRDSNNLYQFVTFLRLYGRRN